MDLEAYKIAADDLLAVMYNDQQEYERIRFQYGLMPGHMPDGNWRKATEAIYKLYETGEPIHDTLVLANAPGVTLDWLLQRAALYDETRTGAVTRSNAELVKKEGLRQGTLRLLTIASSQVAEKSADERGAVVTNLVNALSSIGVGKAIADVKPHEHATKNRELRASKRHLAMPGFGWLDQRTNGYEPGHVWWIGGAYKQRKTTLMLNLILSLLMAGQKPAILSGEMLQEELQEWVEAMLSVSWLLKKGYYGQEFRNSNGQAIRYDAITPKLLQRMYGKYNYLGKERETAIQWAFDTYETLDMRVYDSTAEHGGLTDYASLEAVINRDIVNEGGRIFFIDYLQLFGAPGAGIYDRISYIANNLQRIAKQKKVCIVVLAQLNEQTIRDGSAYSPGVKGGGDPAQTANYFLVTRYNDGTYSQSIDELNVNIKLSRHGAQGDSVNNNFAIHPGSGLMLDQQWIQEINA